jgi:hypothetical protein
MIIKKDMFIIATILLLLPGLCYANVGLPMIFVVWPSMWYMFIPVVLIEYMVIRHYLKEIRPIKLMGLTISANLFSTLIGIPITWMILCAIEFIFGIGLFGADFVAKKIGFPIDYDSNLVQLLLNVVFSAYMGPGGDEGSRIHIALISLLLPFYYASYRFENLVFHDNLSPEKNDDQISNAIKKANIVSYLFLFIVVLICSSYYAITNKLLIALGLIKL